MLFCDKRRRIVKGKSVIFIVIAFLAGIAVAVAGAAIILRARPVSPVKTDGPTGAAEAEQAAEADGADADPAAAFPSWDPDSASLKELTDFVAASVDESDPGYLEPADRIAVFDMEIP